MGYAYKIADCDAARLANLTSILSIGIAGITLLAAVAGGLELSVQRVPTFLTLGLLGALYCVRWRHERTGGDRRIVTVAGLVLVLFAGGFAGGLICLVGQTFAMPLVDPVLHRADVLLGVDLETMIDASIRVPGLPTLLAAAYESSFVLVFATVLIFAWTGRAERACELCGVFNLCLLAATISSTLIPAIGAFHYLSIPAALQARLPAGSGIYHLGQLFALRQAEGFVIDPTQLQGVVTFPSFHMALALMTAAAWRGVPRVRVAIFAWQGLVILSTIPIGGHYVVDLAGGAICWGLVHRLWHKALPITSAKWPSGDRTPAFA